MFKKLLPILYSKLLYKVITSCTAFYLTLPYILKIKKEIDDREKERERDNLLCNITEKNLNIFLSNCPQPEYTVELTDGSTTKTTALYTSYV